MHVDVGVVRHGELQAELDVPADAVGASSQCGIPPTTSAPSRIAATISSSAPGSRQMPSCGNATICIVADVSVLVARGCDAAQAHEPADRVDVDMGADPVVPASTAGRITRPAPRDLVDGRRALDRVQERDRLGQRAGAVRTEQRAGDDLVEVDVRLDEGGRDQPAVGVHLSGASNGPDRHDPPARDREVDERTVDPRVADHEVVAQRSSSIAAAARTAATIPM